MKSIFILATVLTCSLCCSSQSFVLPIYVNDAIGNRDTVYISGDLSASTLLDANLGEINLNGLPYDSVFEARLTHDVFSATRIETVKQALYYECSPLGGYLQPNHLLLRCKNWPVNISWNRHLIDSVGLCINWSGISNDLAYLGGNGPQYYLRNRDSVLYSSNQLLSPFNIGINNGQSAPLYAIAIGISDDGTVGVEDLGMKEISVWPNPSTDELHLQGIEARSYNLSIYDVSGKLVVEYSKLDDYTIDISSFDSGLYIAAVSSQNFTATFKWSKL